MCTYLPIYTGEDASTKVAQLRPVVSTPPHPLLALPIGLGLALYPGRETNERSKKGRGHLENKKMTAQPGDGRPCWRLRAAPFLLQLHFRTPAQPKLPPAAAVGMGFFDNCKLDRNIPACSKPNLSTTTYHHLT